MSNYLFHGCDVVALAQTYGTPLYVMSEDEIVKKIRAVKALFDERVERCLTHYASKAFLTRDMLRILKREGIGLDVVSGGELHLAREMDFDPRLVTFHGNSKTEAEIAAGLDYGVGEFVCDSAEEIATIDRISEARGRIADILIRVSPETESRTHAHMATVGRGSKFGIPPVVLEDAVRLCERLPRIRLRGFHFHVGSQLMDNESHLEGLEAVLGQIARIHASCGYAPETLDMGGGFGVAYTEDDRPEP
ncbi:diaminopimelate decarboxylase, partial [Synergistaceae bacterium OttesenSCG-928-I11]|nr:diaminopimelate decarboxylase [Synergistaceae bacterium OttesenSCG-928-I11]